MNRQFINVLNFFFLLILLIMFYLLVQFVIWPKLLPQVFAPQFLVNLAVSTTLYLKSRHSFYATILLSFFFSTNNNWGLGVSFLAFGALWLLIQMLKKNTFILSSRGVLFLYLSAHVTFWLSYILGGWWAHKKWVLSAAPWAALLTIATSLLCVPLQRRIEGLFLEIHYFLKGLAEAQE